MKSQTTQLHNDSIVVWPDDLRYLAGFLQRTFAKVEYEASCEDGTKLIPTELDDLLDYENPDFKRLASITIRTSDGRPTGNNVEIIMGQASSYTSATSSASFRFADIKEQRPIEDEILKRMRSMRPWYFWLNKVSFKYILPLLLYGVSLVQNGVSLMNKISGFAPSPPLSTSRFTEGESFVFALGVFGILFLVGYLIDRSRDYLFPRFFFCIGRQQKSYEKRRGVAYVIFGMVILGILINLASSFIFQPLSK